MSEKNKSESLIKTRVFISYSLLVVLITGILFFTFKSFHGLTQSTDTLARPNPRINILHEIIISIYHAESNIRAYSLIGAEPHLDAYFKELTLINEKVDSLYILSGNDQFFKHHIDTINYRLLEKTKLLERLIEIRRMDYDSLFYESALNSILQAAEDDTILKEVAHTIVEDTPVKDLVEIVPDEVKREKGNFFSRLRNLFSGRQKERQLSEEEKIQRERQQAQEMMQRYTTNSIVTYHRDTVGLREEIENTMLQLMQSVQERQQYAHGLENSILIADKRVMDRIWHHVTQLEDYETSKDLRQAELAHQTVSRTTKGIFIFVAVSMVILIVFSWLFVNDINKSKYYRNQLIQEKIKAEQLVDVKKRFMANISHEIRTPLNSIIGFSERLRKVKLGNKPDSYVWAISRSSGHLLEIVNDILDFSRIEAGKIEFRPKPFNIKLLAEEVYNTLTVIAEQKKIDFRLESGELKNPLLIGDPLRIKQILLNIAGNALKFTTEGWVKIQFSDNLSPENLSLNVIRIKVSDSGPGISLEEKEKIFEEFSQGDSRTTRKYGGTGLGLTISKRLVEMMGGTIELDSQKGKGATFTIFLPLVVTDTIIMESKPDQPVWAEDLNLRVLVVDDDRINRMLIKSILEQYKGVFIAEADHARKAINLLGNDTFDLIISDVQMPDMSGIEMIQHLRSDTGAKNIKTPVIACTADITPETLTEIINAGFMDYILKPFDESTLIHKILNFSKGRKQDIKTSLHSSNLKKDKNESQPFTENKQSFDLNKLKEFTGNDQQIIFPILEAFIEDTELNLSIIKESLKKGDIGKVSRVAHKMSNMVELLGSDEAAMELKRLSRSKEHGFTHGETILVFSRIEPLVKQLIDGISDYISEVKETT